MTAGRTVNAQNQNWGTPLNYVTAIREFFGGRIELDPCSNVYSIVNAKVEYYLPKNDGLKANWNYKTIFVNPPYGADRERGTRIINWLEKCAEANKNFSSEVLALIPVATNTFHWKKYVWAQARSVAFLYDTRLRFRVDGRDGGKGAPMSCAMVYWGTRVDPFKKAFSGFGTVVDLGPLESRTPAPEKSNRGGRRVRRRPNGEAEVIAGLWQQNLSSERSVTHVESPASVRGGRPDRTVDDLPLWGAKLAAAEDH